MSVNGYKHYFNCSLRCCLQSSSKIVTGTREDCTVTPASLLCRLTKKLSSASRRKSLEMEMDVHSLGTPSEGD